MYWANPDGHIEKLRHLVREVTPDTFETYYPQTAANDYADSDDLYYGRRVIWDGIPGRMLKVKAEYVIPTPGNIFDSQKISAVVDTIEEGHRPIFKAAYGYASKITRKHIIESLIYDEDEFQLTTGDPELDQFLIDTNNVLANYIDLADMAAYEELLTDFRNRLTQAEVNKEGDLGKWQVTLRDGNHRVFGALLAGEPDVYIMIAANQMQDINRGLEPELASLLE